MIIMLYFMFHAYCVSDLIGSPSRMYDLLKAAGEKMPVAGNQDGSFVTLKSNKGLVFGVIQLCAGSGTVFLDQVRPSLLIVRAIPNFCIFNVNCDSWADQLLEIGILATRHRFASQHCGARLYFG